MANLLKATEVAKRLDCSADTVRRLVAAKLLEGPRWYEGLGMRFLESDVLSYLYSQHAANKPPPKRKKV